MELVWPLVLFVILVAVRTKDKYGAKNIPNSKYTTYLSFPSKLLMVLENFFKSGQVGNCLGQTNFVR